jgi:hypothetical protein
MRLGNLRRIERNKKEAEEMTKITGVYHKPRPATFYCYAEDCTIIKDAFRSLSSSSANASSSSSKRLIARYNMPDVAKLWQVGHWITNLEDFFME